VSTVKRDAEAWWANADPHTKAFFRDVVALVEEIRWDEVLEIGFNGRNFSPVLKTKRAGATEAVTEAAAAKEHDVEKWWNGLTSQMKAFVRELAVIVGRIGRDQDEFLELRNTGHGFKAALVLNVRLPGGKAVTN